MNVIDNAVREQIPGTQTRLEQTPDSCSRNIERKIWVKDDFAVGFLPQFIRIVGSPAIKFDAQFGVC
jgi:hypothetical protein